MHDCMSKVHWFYKSVTDHRADQLESISHLFIMSVQRRLLILAIPFALLHLSLIYAAHHGVQVLKPVNLNGDFVTRIPVAANHLLLCATLCHQQTSCHGITFNKTLEVRYCVIFRMQYFISTKESINICTNCVPIK